MENKAQEIQKDLDVVSKLETYTSTKGAEILVKGLVDDIISNINTLSNKHETMTMQEFISLGASTKEKMLLVKAITNVPDNRKLLEELLAEALQW